MCVSIDKDCMHVNQDPTGFNPVIIPERGAAQPKCVVTCSKRIWYGMGGQNGQIVWNRVDTKCGRNW